MSKVLDLWAGMTGTVLDFAGTTAPDGWLMCFGQAVSRTTYANLFAKIGTIYGAGDGSTTFNLPDCRGRVAAGKDDMGGAAANRLTTAGSGVNGAALGAAGGEETHALTNGEMPVHSHGGTADSGGAHTHTASTSSAGDHQHSVPQGGTTTNGGASAAVQPGTTAPVDTSTAGAHTHAVTVNSGGAHTHTLSISTAGGDGAHNNTQPTIIFNKIIKT